MNLNTTQARTDLQIELETLSQQLGIARYREALAQEGNTAVSAGQQLLKAAMKPMEDRLKGWLDETREGLASHTEKRTPVFDGPTSE